MFVKSLHYDFYNVIYGNRCLLLVNFDIDAICASKILQTLFKHDNMVYTLVPVQGVKDMVQAYEENRDEVKYVILVNCGGTLDIVELLEPSEDVTFFIIDNHRPYDLCNIYSEKQVQIVGEPDADEDIPEYNEVFRDESSDEEDNAESEDDAEESNQAKRRRLNEEDILKRRALRQWEETRENILFNYTQYSYYGKSSAVLLFEMTWKMSRDSLEMAWWAIIGATEQAITNKVDSDTSLLEAGNLQGHVSRLSHIRGTNEKVQQSIVKVTYDKDLQLALYRHWSVEASMKHSVPTAVALRLWSIRGEARLREVLAEMGLPLAQAKQRFTAMDLSLRQEFRPMIEKVASKYKMDNIVGASFTLQYGYRFKYCASDVVYAMLALLESTTKDRLPQHCFLEAATCLTRYKKDLLEDGIDKAKLMLTNIHKTAQGILEMKQVVNAGTFLYILLPESTLDSLLFSHSHALLMIAQYVLKAYVSYSRSKRASGWPMVASAKHSEEGMCLMVGVPPTSEDQPRRLKTPEEDIKPDVETLFGKAFEQAAKNTNSAIVMDYFDTTIVRLKIDDRPKFFDALATLLT